MREWQVKRFWSDVSVERIGNGHAVRLDGRAIKTPAKAELILPTAEFAQMVADEWEAQVEKIDPATMPSTRSANAAIDKVSLQKVEVADLLAAYGDSDLLCYRAASPRELVSRQSAIWDPYLNWAEASLGTRLQTHEGIIHRPQESAVVRRLSTLVHEHSNFQLAAFHDLVSLSGSLILGFATTHHFSPAEEIWMASRLDELWQEEQWGQDEEAAALSRQKQAAFLHAAKIFTASTKKH